MRAIWVIAGLTVQEAMRRKLFIISLLVAVIFFVLSLLPYVMGTSEEFIGPRRLRMTTGVLICVFFGMGMLRFFSSLQAVILGTSSLAGELERGTLLVVVTKPVSRVQVVFGKWLGINAIMAVNVAVWAVLLWASLYIQMDVPNYELLYAAGMVVLYPMMFTTLALFFSSFAAPTLAAALTLLCGGIGWAEGILQVVGSTRTVNLPLMVSIGKACSYVVPMAHVDRWIDRVLAHLSPNLFAGRIGRVPVQAASEADLQYVAGYTITLLLFGIFIFHRRDV